MRAVALKVLEVRRRRAALTVPAAAAIEAAGACDSGPGESIVRHASGRSRADAATRPHNPPARQRSPRISARRWTTERLPLVFAAMRDKDVGGDVPRRAAARRSVPWLLTRPINPRSADPEALARVARDIAPDAVDCGCARCHRWALELAWRASPQRIAVAGSIFLLGDVIKRIGASDWTLLSVFRFVRPVFHRGDGRGPRRR